VSTETAIEHEIIRYVLLLKITETELKHFVHCHPRKARVRSELSFHHLNSKITFHALTRSLE